jgi:acyl dehydratase
VVIEKRFGTRLVDAVQLTLANIDTIEVGDHASCRMTVTESLVDAFADVCLDDNSLHMDNGFAQTLGFRGRVAHGLVALSAISRLIGTQLPGHGSLWVSQDIQFVAPVFIGDTLEVRVTVEKVSAAARLVELAVVAIHCDTRDILVRGRARVRVPRIQSGSEMIVARTLAAPSAGET